MSTDQDETKQNLSDLESDRIVIECSSSEVEVATAATAALEKPGEDDSDSSSDDEDAIAEIARTWVEPSTTSSSIRPVLRDEAYWTARIQELETAEPSPGAFQRAQERWDAAWNAASPADCEAALKRLEVTEPLTRALLRSGQHPPVQLESPSPVSPGDRVPAAAPAIPEIDVSTSPAARAPSTLPPSSHE